MNKKNKAQSTVEIVVIVACVAWALLMMSIYVRKGLSGKYKNLVDANLDSQYDPSKGNYAKVISESGHSASMSRLETRNETDFSGNETKVDYMMIYQTAGDDYSVSWQYENGTVEGTLPTGKPMESTTVTHSELGWEDLSMQ